jgi:hypothetical protein
MNIEQAVLDSLRILPKKNNRNRTYAHSTNPWRSWRLGETSPRLGGSRHDGGLANP